jgi:hypothetical protein
VASTIVLIPSTDKTGATDTAAINTALGDVGGGGSVLLGPGDWYTAAPLNIPDGTELAGIKSGINGHTSMHPTGSVIHPVADFSGRGVLNLSAVSGVRIRELAILNDIGSPANVDGISCRGNVNGLEILHVSVARVSGYGLAYFQSAGVDGDGLWMSRCMFQRTGKSAVHRPVNDANIHNVHIQYAGTVAGPADGHGFFSDAGSAGNMTYVGCRVDLCAGSGWLIDHKGSFGDATKLVGCSTERNGQNGVLITNSSGAGTDWRSPVIISGCCFEGDGTNQGPATTPATGGEFAGIRVQGRNRVFIDGTTVVVSKTDVKPAGAPKYALGINQIGSAPGRAETIEWASGRMNYSTGQGGQAIQNHSLVDHLVIGPTVTQVGGFQSTDISPRAGQVALAGGTATVSSPWAFPQSLIYLTVVGPSAAMGTPFVSARAAGSFTIESTSDTDTSTVAWMIM